jgi:hypothetical protein
MPSDGIRKEPMPEAQPVPEVGGGEIVSAIQNVLADFSPQARNSGDCSSAEEAGMEIAEAI